MSLEVQIRRTLRCDVKGCEAWFVGVGDSKTDSSFRAAAAAEGWQLVTGLNRKLEFCPEHRAWITKGMSMSENASPEDWSDDLLHEHIMESQENVATFAAERARLAEEYEREVHFYRRLTGIRDRRKAKRKQLIPEETN